jgi:hypothetical protein
VGSEKAENIIFIRGRVHPWESGTNWVIEGIIKTLLDGSKESQSYLKNYCVYILPMCNIDGVARGLSRFNANGMDLNRNMTTPADPVLSPENAAMEKWIERMIAEGKKPDLAIDLHDDANGRLHFVKATDDKKQYTENMKTLEALLRKHSWFTEGNQVSTSTTFAEGLLMRYGIDALVYELNAYWVKGLQKAPLSQDWLLLGSQVTKVFDEYFKETITKK